MTNKLPEEPTNAKNAQVSIWKLINELPETDIAELKLKLLKDS